MTYRSRYAENVVDADLCEYYESIPHSELLHSVARRVWTTAAVEGKTSEGARSARPATAMRSAVYHKVLRLLPLRKR
jgi:hypothetical protein